MAVESKVALTGKTLLKGVACGPLFFYEEHSIAHRAPQEDTLSEVKKYQRAISITKKELSILAKRFQEFSDKEALQIFEAHLAILEDPLFAQQIEEEIIRSQISSEQALEKTLNGVITVLEISKNPYFAERAVDIKDLAQRISSHLQGIQPKLPQEFQGAIVCVHEVTPSMAAEGALKGVRGFISVKGSSASHTAVVLKSRSIPHIALAELDLLRPFQGQPILLDGTHATVVVHPSLELMNQLFKEESKGDRHTAKKSGVETADGTKIEVFSTFDGVEYSHELQQGIGLYRTEFLLLHDREVAFCEERQIVLYQSILEDVEPQKVVFRLFDLGGDKNFLEDQEITVRSLRSVQYLLHRTEILDLQIRSLLQAIDDQPLHILIPFTSSVEEVLLLQERIEMHQTALGIEVPVQLGAMIESLLPEDVLDAILEIIDFIAVGTNDLTQGLISIHRDSPDFCHFQPVVFRTIQRVIEGAKRFNVPVSICGEIVSNPIFTETLLGLGATEFSCSFHEIPEIKARIATLDLNRAIALAAKVCLVETPQEVKALLLEEPL